MSPMFFGSAFFVSMIRCALLLATPLSLVGCGDIFGDQNAHLPGTALGTFHVSATQTSNGCGEGALGSVAGWEFDVELARGETNLFWDNGIEVISGNLSENKTSFSFETGIVVDMRTEEQLGLLPCSLARRDLAAGELDTAEEKVEGFEGSLTYQFAPTQDSECEDLVVSETPVFLSLPCNMAYEMTAKRTAEPPSE